MTDTARPHPDAARTPRGRKTAVLAAALAALATLIPVAPPTFAALTDAGGDMIEFLVRRAGDEIGSHRISIEQDGALTRVQVDIRIEVDVLFFNAYRYVHRNNEVWRDGRLVSLDATTDNDGEDLFVRGRATEGGFAVTHADGSHVAPADVVPTSYWHPKTVEQTRMLNTQTGKMIDVSIENRGDTMVETVGGTVQTTRYDIDGELDADLYYDRQGRLASIAFYPPDSDTLIAYERRQ